MSKIAVTGSYGFIGSRVAELLSERGSEIVRVDLKDGVDILNSDLNKVFEGCDSVIHLAGNLGTSELFDEPISAIRSNVEGACRVLQACEVHDMNFVGITMPYVWENVYQTTKKAAAGLATAWNKHKSVPVSHVRAFNAFGKRQKVHHVQKIIPTFATRAWRNEPIPVWGDGDQIVDLVFVDDVARMLIHALEYGNDEIFDAGTGSPVTVNQVAEMVINITNSSSDIQYLPMRKGEHKVDIIAKGEGWDRIGWKPEFRMDDLVETVNWYSVDRQ